jgi:predicted glycosyltransferase involved in capsule biosynthesis
MKAGNKVKLISFNGKERPGRPVYNSENYWKLIGETGIVQQDPKENSIHASFSKERRVLVKFNKNLKDYGLITHNVIENALYRPAP